MMAWAYSQASCRIPLTASYQDTDLPDRKSAGTDSGQSGPGKGGGSPGDGGETTELTGKDLLYSRVHDIVRLAPTTNGELAEAWDMIDDREAWDHLRTDLREYFERDDEKMIQPTSKALDMASSEGEGDCVECGAVIEVGDNEKAGEAVASHYKRYHGLGD